MDFICRLTLLTLLSLLTSLSFSQGIELPGGPGGGGVAPAGYSTLNEDWWIKTEFDGSLVAHGFNWIGGQAVPFNMSMSWPPYIGGVASNATPFSNEVFIHSEGDITIHLLWRHGLNPLPPSFVRVRLSGGVSCGASGVHSYELNSGIGLPSVADTEATDPLFSRSTPGVVLRKIAIDLLGAGQFRFHQKARISGNEPGLMLSANAPAFSIEIDPRDIEITGVNGQTPLTKGPISGHNTKTTTLPQDQYSWFSFYHDNRVFTYDVHDAISPLLTFPTDLTDSATWHIGLPSAYVSLTEPPAGYTPPRQFQEVLYIASIVMPASGDLWRWTLSRPFPPGPPAKTQIDGVFDPEDLLSSRAMEGTYVSPMTVASQWLVGLPGTYTTVFTDPGDSNSADPVSLQWTWASDGLIAESLRNVVFHLNAEPDGQESNKWVDVRADAGYQNTTFSADGNSPIPGWVAAGIPDATIIVNPGYASTLQVVASLASGGGPGGAIFMTLAGLESGTLAVAFASVELAGALLNLLPNGEETFHFYRSTFSTGQCDSLSIDPPLYLDADGDGLFEWVERADYKDRSALEALKAAIYEGSFPIQSFLWRMKHRLTQTFGYEVYDKWGVGGYQGPELRIRRKDRELSQAYYHMEFKWDDPQSSVQ